MWRGFFSLYAVVFLALALSFFVIMLPLNWYIENRIHEKVNQTASGIFYLLEQKIDQDRDKPRPELLKELNQFFPYGVEIIDTDAVKAYKLSRCAKKHFNQGKIAYHGRPNDFLLKHLGDSNEVLKLNWKPTPEYDNDKIGQGAFRLIEQQLSGVPVTRWREKLVELGTHFEFPLEVISTKKISLPKNISQILDQGQLATQYIGKDQYFIYGRIDGSDLIVRAGPLSDEIRINNYKVIAIPFVLTALAILFWMHSLWRDIKRMNATTSQFGKGELTARMNLGKRSALACPALQFNQMAGDIEKLIEGSRELTNAVSHDIKTPLARMRFALEMLEKNPTPDMQQRFVSSIEGDIEELEGLVDEVMANARYERQLSLSPEVIPDFFNWIRNILERKQQDDPHVDVEYRNEMPDADAAVKADKKAMARAVGNVFRNALHYASGRVRVTVALEQDNCVVLIEDDGPGIPESDRERVLQPFVRLDSARKRDGHGLGLAIAHRIIQQHGGELLVTQSTWGGAAIRLNWPL